MTPARAFLGCTLVAFSPSSLWASSVGALRHTIGKTKQVSTLHAVDGATDCVFAEGNVADRAQRRSLSLKKDLWPLLRRWVNFELAAAQEQVPTNTFADQTAQRALLAKALKDPARFTAWYQDVTRKSALAFQEEMERWRKERDLREKQIKDLDDKIKALRPDGFLPSEEIAALRHPDGTPVFASVELEERLGKFRGERRRLRALEKPDAADVKRLEKVEADIADVEKQLEALELEIAERDTQRFLYRFNPQVSYEQNLREGEKRFAFAAPMNEWILKNEPLLRLFQEKREAADALETLSEAKPKKANADEVLESDFAARVARGLLASDSDQPFAFYFQLEATENRTFVRSMAAYVGTRKAGAPKGILFADNAPERDEDGRPIKRDDGSVRKPLDDVFEKGGRLHDDEELLCRDPGQFSRTEQ